MSKALAQGAVILAVTGLIAAGCGHPTSDFSAAGCFSAMKQAYKTAESQGNSKPASEPPACQGVSPKTLRAYAGKIIAQSLASVPCSAQVASWKQKFAKSGIADDYKQLVQAESPQPSNVTVTGQSQFLETAAQAAQAIPVPKCADTADYWGQFVRGLWAGARSDNRVELLGDAAGAVIAFRHLKAELKSEGYSPS